MKCFYLTSLSLILLLAIFSGCSTPKHDAVSQSREEATARFLKQAEEELGLKDIQAVSLQNTTYIYLPIEHDIPNIKAAPMSGLKTNQPVIKNILNYIDARYRPEDRTFVIDFDVSPSRAYPESPGYGMNFDDRFSEKQNALNHALLQAFTDTDIEHVPQAPDDNPTIHEMYFKRNTYLPVFIVMVIADTIKGIEYRATFNFIDYKRVMTQSLAQDEYVKRYLYELIGSADIIGDKQGKHIEYKDLSWVDFLARQIAHRVKFKYQQSSFQPSVNSEAEILKMCYETFSGYAFEDFDKIELNDLNNKGLYTFTKDEIMNVKEKIKE